MRYIPTIGEKELDNRAEKEFFDSLKNAFNPEEKGVIYYNYPLKDESSNSFQYEPDFVIFHKDLGIVIIECEEYCIDEIEYIKEDEWEFKNKSLNITSPITRAKKKASHLKSIFEKKINYDKVKKQGIINFVVSFPNIMEGELETKGYKNSISKSKIIYEDQLTPKKLKEKLFEAQETYELNTDEYKLFESILNFGHSISERGGIPENADSKGKLHLKSENQLKRLDKDQEEIGITIPPGPQQVRGVAGSGKTILLAMKAARMHLKNPDWDIALTFSTRSLKHEIIEHIHKFYNDFTSKSLPNHEKLKTLVAWGGAVSGEGLYYNLCKELGEDYFSYQEAKELCDDNENPLEYCSKKLLENHDLPQIYDAILIDEAQDFGPNFLKLCYDILKEPKRLIWAFDEAQSLRNLEAPKPVNIFGTDDDGELKVDLRGVYKGGIRKSHVMRKSYRSPREILMSAHIFGMGLKRKAGAVQAITTQEGWENIGYEVIEGDFRDVGETVKITRPISNSPHPLRNEESAKPFINLHKFNDRESEINKVVESIKNDIQKDDLNPEDIIVIILTKSHNKDKENSSEETNKEKNITQQVVGNEDITEDNVNIASELESKLTEENIEVEFSWRGDRNIFSQKNRVTISGIFQAKGNEASQVYLMAFDRAGTNKEKSLLQRRNEVFSAITRSKIWCNISGVDEGEKIFTEMEEILDDIRGDGEPIIEFEAPDPNSLEKELSDETIKTTLDDYKDDENEILKLIEKGENKRIEFKETAFFDVREEEKVSYIKREIAREICSLANTEGGTVLIGIDDNKNIKGIDRDLKILGKETSHEKRKDKFELQLSHEFSAKLGNSFCSNNLDLNFSHVDGELICHIEIDKCSEPLYYKTSNSSEFFVRNGSEKVSLDINEVVKYINNHWDEKNDQKKTVPSNKEIEEIGEEKSGKKIKEENQEKNNDEGKSYIDKIRETYPRAYKEWTEKEEENLIDLYKQGEEIEKISEILQRQPSAIKSRLSKLDLD